MDHVSLIPVTELHRWDRNPRLHPEANIAALCASLRSFGLARIPVLATWPGQSEGVIIAGNGITTALLQMYQSDPTHPPQGVEPGTPWTIPVRPRIFDSEKQAIAYGLVDNWSTEASQDDPTLVQPLLLELQEGGFDMTGLFLEPEELGVLLNPPDDTPEPEDTDVGEPEAQGEPVSQLGEVYELGVHLLVCGDSRDALVWKVLLGSVNPNVVLCDPPYGLGDSVSDKNNYSGYSDTKDNLIALIEDMLPIALATAPVVVLTPGNGNHRLYPAPNWTMAWFTPAGSGSGPWGFCCWQPILCYGKDPKLSAGLGRHPDAIVHTETAEKFGHPCTKPIKFWIWLTERVSEQGQTVIDPFGGSGTTLIACAQTGRKARLIEIDPRYCDVIRRRWTRWAKEAGVDAGSGALDAQ